MMEAEYYCSYDLGFSMLLSVRIMSIVWNIYGYDYCILYIFACVSDVYRHHW
jgi:hypothetical protein